MATPFATLSPAGMAAEFAAIAGETTALFGTLDAHQLNWKPDAAAWSVAECFDHLVKSGDEMHEAIDRALDRTRPQTMWQRLPCWPRLFGWMLITSLSPDGTRKLKAPGTTTPSIGSLTPDVLDRFAALQHTGIARLEALTAEDARRVMVSPFVSYVTYTVIDGYRIIAVHQRRHLEQARRVTQASGFPAA
jgi:hypothetical protein